MLDKFINLPSQASRAAIGMLFLLVTGAALFASEAFSQSRQTEAELEQAAREIAIEAVKERGDVLRWAPDRFPLQVAFMAGPSLDHDSCSNKWPHQIESYIQFINTSEYLLNAVPIATNTLAAFVFYGSVEELEASGAGGLQEPWHAKWYSRSGIEARSWNQDRFNHSYLFVYGDDRYLQFGARFIDLENGLSNCDAFHPDLDLAEGFLSSYIPGIVARVQRQYGDNVDHTLAWRVHRRLLSAMRKLPDHLKADTPGFKSSFIKVLEAD
jgi:hypothetical protein